jgi:hypothetical protein
MNFKEMLKTLDRALEAYSTEETLERLSSYPQGDLSVEDYLSVPVEFFIEIYPGEGLVEHSVFCDAANNDYYNDEIQSSVELAA